MMETHTRTPRNSSRQYSSSTVRGIALDINNGSAIKYGGRDLVVNGHSTARNSSRSLPRNGKLLCDRIKMADSPQTVATRRYTKMMSQHDRDGKGGKGYTRAAIRPQSAPETSKRRRRPRYTGSASASRTYATVQNEDEDMHKVVQAAKEARAFQEDTELFRNLEKSLQNPEGEEKKDSAPVFNKRLFASQGTVIMTREARRLMCSNTRANESCDLQKTLTKNEITCLRCVTEGLKLIHRGQDFVKDVLSRVITYEIYNAFEHVPVKPWEESLSCYYILNGAVEVTYDMRSRQSRNVYQANIIYSHGTGEYLGLVSPEGPTEDLAPPATIYTKELTQFIRVDRQRFHKLMAMATDMIDTRKREYISSHSFLANVSDNVKEKVLHKLSLQEYQANRVLLAQGETTDYLFIVISGRCQTYREVYIPEADKDVLFYLTSRNPDDFFGEECLLDHIGSYCTVVTATASTCLKLHRTALEMVNREKLIRHIEVVRHQFPGDQELRNRGYKDSMWNKYKHGQIKESLREGGKLHYLNKAEAALVLERPPQENELYEENIRRFVMKGSQMVPLRAQSAINRKSRNCLPSRPQTAFMCHVTEQEDEPTEQTSTEEVSEEKPVQKQSLIMSTAKAKEMEKHMETRKQSTAYKTFLKAMESKDNLMKFLDEHTEVSSQIKQAWKAEGAQELQQNFMKNGVLVTMTSEDIVRKAKALADTYADKWKTQMSDTEEEDWDTKLHAENKQAKMLISANKLRIKDIKRRMAELQKQREKTRLKNQRKKEQEETLRNARKYDMGGRKHDMDAFKNALPQPETLSAGIGAADIKTVSGGTATETITERAGEDLQNSVDINQKHGIDGVNSFTKHDNGSESNVSIKISNDSGNNGHMVFDNSEHVPNDKKETKGETVDENASETTAIPPAVHVHFAADTDTAEDIERVE